MLTRIGLTLVLFVAIPQVNAEGFHARVQVLTSGDQALAAEVQRYVIHGLEEIGGVVTVGKDPDVMIVVSVMAVPLKDGEIVGLAVTAYDRVPYGSAEALLKGRATQERVHDAQVILSTLVPISVPKVIAGRRDQLSFLCSELVSFINRTSLEKARKYPFGDRTPTRLA